MSIELITVLLFATMVVLLALGLPLAFALGGTGVIFILILEGPTFLLGVPVTVIAQMRTFVLIAIPLFIFMAMVLERAGIADELYELMYRWMGPVRGGLAMGTVIICTLFAAMAGISGAATVTMGLVALPSMLKRGYNKQIAVGCIAAGGALGVLIPPSVMMIIYALFAEESVGRLFAGGVMPGILLSGLFILYIGIRSWLQPDLGPGLPAEQRASWAEKLGALKAVILPIALVIAVLGSIFAGIATPTEAAAVGAVGAIVCSLVLKRFTWGSLWEASKRTMKLTSMIIWIVVGASIFVKIYTAVGAQTLVRDIIVSLPVSPIIILLGIQLTFFIMGMFLDPTGIVMLTAPIFVPVAKSIGWDPIWFGILYAMNMEMAFLTPPFGVNLFYLKGIVPKDVSMADIYRSIIPFVGLQAIGLVLVIVFPQIATWLPNRIFGRQIL